MKHRDPEVKSHAAPRVLLCYKLEVNLVLKCWKVGSSQAWQSKYGEGKVTENKCMLSLFSIFPSILRFCFQTWVLPHTMSCLFLLYQFGCNQFYASKNCLCTFLLLSIHPSVHLPVHPSILFHVWGSWSPQYGTRNKRRIKPSQGCLEPLVEGMKEW